MTVSYLYADPFLAVFEEGDPAPSISQPAPDPAPAPTPTSEAKPQVFDQEKVNKIVADEKRKHQEQLKKALAEIDALTTRSSLTEKERAELEARLETVRSESLTKEQLAKKKLKELQDEKDGRIKQLELEKKEWEDRYMNTTIQRSLVDAAAKHQAYAPEQIVYMLKDNTRLVKELDEEGKPTGNYVAKVKLQDTSPEGQPVTLEFSPDAAVERMKELDKYKNLFQAEGTGGLGLLSSPPSKKADLATLASDPEAYRKARKEGHVSF